MNKLWVVVASFVGALLLIWQVTYNNENYFANAEQASVYGHNNVDQMQVSHLGGAADFGGE
jgi:hypothetical protein